VGTAEEAGPAPVTSLRHDVRLGRLICGTVWWAKVQADIDFDIVIRNPALSSVLTNNPASLVYGVGGLIGYNPGSIKSS